MARLHTASPTPHPPLRTPARALTVPPSLILGPRSHAARSRAALGRSRTSTLLGKKMPPCTVAPNSDARRSTRRAVARTHARAARLREVSAHRFASLCGPARDVSSQGKGRSKPPPLRPVEPVAVNTKLWGMRDGLGARTLIVGEGQEAARRRGCRRRAWAPAFVPAPRTRRLPMGLDSERGSGRLHGRVDCKGSDMLIRIGGKCASRGAGASASPP